MIPSHRTILLCLSMVGALAVTKLLSKPMQPPFLVINEEERSKIESISTESGRLTIKFPKDSQRGVSAEIFSWGVANMICLGCQKCATTTLKTILTSTKNHSIIASGAELHFFDKIWPSHGWDKSEDMTPAIQIYAKRWRYQRSNPEKTVRLQKTPIYLYSYEVPWRMAKMYGALGTYLKLFAILRDPVDRAVSGYFQAAQHLDRAALEQSIEEDLISALGILEECYGIITLHKKECPTFEEETQQRKAFTACVETTALTGCADCSDHSSRIKRALELSSVLERGVYVNQIQRYLCAGFPAHNLLILPFTKFTWLSPDQVVEVLESFTDGTDIDMPLQKHLDIKKTSRTRGFVLSNSTRHRLQEFFDPWNKRLGQFLTETGIAHDTTTDF